jgi:hypothetical protein
MPNAYYNDGVRTQEGAAVATDIEAIRQIIAKGLATEEGAAAAADAVGTLGGPSYAVNPGSGWTGPTPVARNSDIRAGDELRLLDFIPTAQHPAIRAGTSTYDVRALIESLQAGLVAARGGGTLIYPEGRVYTLKSPQAFSRITHRGAGVGGSTIYNPRLDAQGDHWAAFLFGNAHPYAIRASNGAGNIYAIKALNAVALGSNQVTFTTAADDAAASVGQWVLVYSTDGFDTGVVRQSYQQYYAKIIAKPSSGVLTLNRRAPFAIASASIGLVTNTDPTMGVPWRIAENIGVRDMTIDAAHIGSRGGVWNGLFQNLELVNGVGIASLNAMMRCVFRNIACDNWWYSWAEFKHASDEVLVENCRGQYFYNGSAPYGVINLGESARNITFKNCGITVGVDWPTTTKNVIVAQNGENFRVLDSDFLLLGVMNSLLACDKSTVAAYVASGVHFRGNRVQSASSLNRLFSLGAGSGTNKPTDIFLTQNECRGALISAAGTTNRYIDGQLADGVALRDNIFPVGSTANVAGLTNYNTDYATMNWLIG